MKNGMEAPPAIAAKLPTTIKVLSRESEYLNNEKKGAGLI
jgi:hypothetical protein